MLTDYMLESLILLKWKLCLSMEDLIFFSSNKRSNSEDTETSQKNLTLNEQMRKWNSADYLLYEVANRTFWETVKDFGISKMEREKIGSKISVNFLFNFITCTFSTIYTKNDSLY